MIFSKLSAIYTTTYTYNIFGRPIILLLLARYTNKRRLADTAWADKLSPASLKTHRRPCRQYRAMSSHEEVYWIWYPESFRLLLWFSHCVHLTRSNRPIHMLCTLTGWQMQINIPLSLVRFWFVRSCRNSKHNFDRLRFITLWSYVFLNKERWK